ncbi:MAG TPA: ABC transporter ATP-binding protein [Achromobacter sp.]|nr:ABC transporter ATP-binding protein [Achromobacter sp.]
MIADLSRPFLHIDGAVYTYPGRAPIVNGIDWRLQAGGFHCLVGRSGCGKTTLLNCVSGLLRPSHGRILFDGQDVTAKSPQARNIAQVFQFPVVYDTMTVADNLAFPLRNRGVPPERIRERVGRIAEMLEMSHVLDRRASGLTADAKQKISLGRGLVRSDVSAILFDEPLTVIDPQLKWELRRKLKEIHHEFKLTLIYVTHDQTEALTFAEQVMVMARGRAVQVGSADDLFQRPAHTFVGHFIGSPGMNFLPAQWRDDALWVGNTRVPGAAPNLATKLAGTGAIKLGVRPEHIRIDSTGIPAIVESVEYFGADSIVVCRVGDTSGVAVRVGGHLRARAGEALNLSWQDGQQHFFAADSAVINTVGR